MGNGNNHQTMSISTNVTSAPTGPMLGLLSESSFTQLVNDALRNYTSTLALSRSALANSPLMTPTLVKDEASPTAEERGHGLRLLLQWAVNGLAPNPPTYPLGTYRPLGDPTWHDPRWWRYNILRHRYLEPLHPDDFVDGGRYTESLLALTGISSTDTFFDERNRAIRAVAAELRQQLIDGQANSELQRLALQEALLPLEKQSEAAHLLGIAATFDDIFPRNLLLEMATQEAISKPASTLDALIAQRFLLTGDAGTSLWLSPVLRAYVYTHQPKPDRQRRHRWIANDYEMQRALLPAARHWQHANQDARAVRILLPVVDELIRELQVKDLIEFFQTLDEKLLVADQWYDVQLLLSDLFYRSGQQEEALVACRQALQASEEPSRQARVYRRMGKLYESRNQLHALRYYQQAVQRFPPTDPELAELLKDRGWLYFLRREWEKAEHDLQQALQITPAERKILQADIYDAIASLNREMGNHGRALAYAERALARREEEGDLLRIAKSHGNLGLFYRTMGEYGHAIAAYQEAMVTYQRIGNQELVAVALLNIGAAYFLNKKTDAAINAYQQSLAICQTIGLPVIEIKAHYNLAEASMAANRTTEAAGHWHAGYQLCQQHNFDDLEALFLTLHKTIQIPASVSPAADESDLYQHPILATAALATHLDTDEEFVLALAQREKSLTPKRLMSAASISRATATRRLTRLVEKGYLAVHGKGRSAHYMPVATPAKPAKVSTIPASPSADVDSAVLDSVRSALQGCQQELATRFAVSDLGLLMPNQLSPPWRLVVHFAQTPDLEHFFALKHYLTASLQAEVDVVPDFVCAAMPTQQNVEWLWQ